MRHFYVYIMASRTRVLYTGVTSNVCARIWQHKHDELPGFTRDYRVHRLVYLERFKMLTTRFAAKRKSRAGYGGRRLR
jgi:putative endonuclease